MLYDVLVSRSKLLCNNFSSKTGKVITETSLPLFKTEAMKDVVRSDLQSEILVTPDRGYLIYHLSFGRARSKYLVLY